MDKSYISQVEAEAHRLRAQAYSNLISNIAANVARLFSTAFQWVAVEIKKNRERNELYALDARSLADLGITRGDIDGIVDGTVTRELYRPAPKNVTVLKQPKVETAEQKLHDDSSIAA